MKRKRSNHQPVWRERLSVPATWWAMSLAIMGFGGLEVFGGFNWEVAIVTYLILSGFFIVPLAILGRAVVSIDGGVLQAGGKSLALDQVRTASALDVEGTRRALGPAADPAAHVVLRGWIRTAVLVRVRGAGPTPYWLISTREPEQLAAALRNAGHQGRRRGLAPSATKLLE